MTLELLETILSELGLPHAYFQFKSKPASIPYIAYFEDEKVEMFADNVVYHFEPRFAVELYSKVKAFDIENELIALFEKYEVVWTGGVSAWIESEKMFQTVFYC